MGSDYEDERKRRESNARFVNLDIYSLLIMSD